MMTSPNSLKLKSLPFYMREPAKVMECSTWSDTSCRIYSCVDSPWTNCQFGSKWSITCQIGEAMWLFVREVQGITLGQWKKTQVSQLQGDQMTSFRRMTPVLWSLGLQSPLLSSAQVTANVLAPSTQWDRGHCWPYKWIPLTSQKQR